MNENETQELQAPHPPINVVADLSPCPGFLAKLHHGEVSLGVLSLAPLSAVLNSW
jgi:hypothetical protein